MTPNDTGTNDGLPVSEQVTHAGDHPSNLGLDSIPDRRLHHPNDFTYTEGSPYQHRNQGQSPASAVNQKVYRGNAWMDLGQSGIGNP